MLMVPQAAAVAPSLAAGVGAAAALHTPQVLSAPSLTAVWQGAVALHTGPTALAARCASRVTAKLSDEFWVARASCTTARSLTAAVGSAAALYTWPALSGMGEEGTGWCNGCIPHHGPRRRGLTWRAGPRQLGESGRTAACWPELAAAPSSETFPRRYASSCSLLLMLGPCRGRGSSPTKRTAAPLAAPRYGASICRCGRNRSLTGRARWWPRGGEDVHSSTESRDALALTLLSELPSIPTSPQTPDTGLALRDP